MGNMIYSCATRKSEKEKVKNRTKTKTGLRILLIGNRGIWQSDGIEAAIQSLGRGQKNGDNNDDGVCNVLFFRYTSSFHCETYAKISFIEIFKSCNFRLPTHV